MGKLKMLGAEFLKIRRTWILWLHIVMPFAGILIFLLYYKFSAWNDWGKISGYVQAVSAICPTLVGFVCAMAAEQEKQAGHFQNFLGTGRHRGTNLAVKLGFMMLWNFMAMLLAIGGFGAGFYLFVSKTQVPAGFYFVIILLLWVPQLFEYCFHFYLGMRFSKGICIGAGVAESLVSAIMMTGLGEGIWQWIPCSWAGRLTGYCISYGAGLSRLAGQAKNQMVQGGGMMLLFTLAAVLLVFAWFHFYEGKQMED